jgi:serine/threonine-protein kinase RsbW
MLDGNTIQISLPNKMGYERIAMECSAAFAKTLGMAKERVEDLKTVVSEACTNAIEHGNKLNPDARVIVLINYAQNTLRVSVIDKGDGIKEFPEDHDVLSKIENLEPPNGLGLYLIKKLADHVKFNQMTNDGHMVTIKIKL